MSPVFAKLLRHKSEVTLAGVPAQTFRESFWQSTQRTLCSPVSCSRGSWTLIKLKLFRAQSVPSRESRMPFPSEDFDHRLREPPQRV